MVEVDSDSNVVSFERSIAIVLPVASESTATAGVVLFRMLSCSLSIGCLKLMINVPQRKNATCSWLI